MRLFALLFICVLAALPGTARTFAGSDGDMVGAEITKATEETVTLRNTSGKFLTLPLAQLSEADRDHVRNWREEQVPKLRAIPHFTTSDHGTGTTPAHQVLNLSVDLECESGPENVEARLKYILIGRDMENENRYKVLAIQTNNFEIEGGKPTKVTFKTVKNYYQSGKDVCKGARCIGYVLHASRKSDHRTLFTTASTPVLEKALHAIITLKIGEETDEDFIPLSANHSDHSRDVTAK